MENRPWFVKTSMGYINLAQVVHVEDKGTEVVVHFALSYYLTIPIPEGGAEVISAIKFMK
jgi:hypothetical protein